MNGLNQFAHEHNVWIAAGRPLRSKERTAQLYAEKCEPCPHRVDNACGLCGCTISPTMRFVNKLAWATTVCPKSPPEFVEEPQLDREPSPLFVQAQSLVVRSALAVGMHAPCGGCGGNKTDEFPRSAVVDGRGVS